MKAVELVEESLRILRTAGAIILLPHWTGSLPFGLSLLLLLHDMTLSWGASLLLRDSLACSITFFWLCYWKGLASRSTLSLINPDFESQFPALKLALFQALFQTFKLFAMPFAIASILAGPAASVFFRSLALEPPSVSRPIRSSLRRAFASATTSYAQNLLSFLLMATVALVVYLNILILFITLPIIWRTLTGYETQWSRMGLSTMAGMPAVAGVATWLLVDPWIQTYCVLRVFYQNARSDGRDLLRDLSRLAAIAVFCSIASFTATASQPQQQKFDQTIQRLSQNSDYAWLRPQPSNTGVLAELAQDIHRPIAAAAHQIEAWFRTLDDWLKRVMGSDQAVANDQVKSKPQGLQLRWTLSILAVLICGGLVALFFRRARIRTTKTGTPATASITADVLDEQLLPTDVNQEEWLRLAFEYLSNNQTRLAARAFYLANLSYLGAHNLLSLSLSKSNRLYERELARQPKSTGLLPAFISANRLYERAWYGMRELGEQQVESLKGAADQLRQHA